MPVRIKSKNSVVKDKAPLPADLEIGELALNAHQDSPAIYLKDAAGAVRKIAGAGAVGATDATTTSKGVVQLADAAAVTAGTAGRVVDAAQLKSAVDTNDEWTRTGTTIHPKTAGDVVEISAGTAALPGLTPVGDPNTGLWSPGADQLAVSSNGSERLRITSDGKVGIGTSTPATKLHMQAALGYNILQIDSGTVGSYLYSESAGQLGWVGTRTNHPFVIGANATERLRIAPTGLVGINSVAPGATLDVKAVAGTNPLIISSPSSEFARIDSSGRLLVGASAAVAGSAAKLQCSTTANLSAVATYADNTAAKAGGLVAGDIYRTAAGQLMITF